jgi:signal transduction histidine kinase
LTAALLILEAIRTGRIPSEPNTWDELTEELRQIQAIVPKFIDVDPHEVLRTIDLSAFFPAFAERHKEVFATKGMTVALDLEPLSVEIAEVDLNRIAEHLVFNAFYYGKENGTIRIRTRTSTCVLEIEDDGIGMTQETLERIQSGPYRTEAAGKLHATGLGLGIGIVRGIVTRLGAEMEIRSKVGVGTTVWIRFPH